MFWSKIWLFVITLAASVALTVALVMPRPAQRVRAQTEQQRLVLACSVVNIQLGVKAQNRVELAGSFARYPEVVAALTEASDAPEIDDARAKAGGVLAKTVSDRIKPAAADADADADDVKPSFVILLDRKGRVLARLGGEKAGDFGDTLAGRALVDDALAGYLRDDVWSDKSDKGALYLVAASPVVRRDAPVAYEGAVVLGYQVSRASALKLVKPLDVNLAFFLGGEPVANTTEAVFAKDALTKAVPSGAKLSDDCTTGAPFDLKSGDKSYSALVARLPGEARMQGAFFSVYLEKAAAVGFSGTLNAVRQNDLGFGTFPWLLVGALLVLALGIGMFLLVWETDRPLRRLNADAVKLAKGETERLAEEEHHGKFGSIARSVNIQVDKLHRDAKSARKDLDQLLGPAPEGSLGAMDLVAAVALPAARPGLPLGMPSPSLPPPPSEFRFGEGGPAAAPRASGPGPGPAPSLDLGPPPQAQQARPATPAVARPTPPPKPAAAKPPIPSTPAPPAKRAMEDDILGAIEDPMDPTSVGAEPNSPQEDAYYHTVFDQFVDMKKKCGESITGLTFPKFADKLRKNRDELMSKTVCRSVKFTVYVKDGKAALKATPVKE